MIGYARLVVARNSSNQSQGSGSKSVIDLGHKAEQPLMYRASELSYGIEPHDHIWSSPRGSSVDHGPAVAWEGCTRGAVLGGCREGNTGY